MFCQTSSRAYKFLEYCKETIAVGRMFYIVEPERSESSLAFLLVLSMNLLLPMHIS